jgi:pentatricopeptide repeat protein
MLMRVCAARVFACRHLRKGHAWYELRSLCDTFVYTTMVSLCGPHEVHRALELVAEMETRAVAINVHTYSALLNVCLKANQLDLAISIRDQMLQVQPPLPTVIARGLGLLCIPEFACVPCLCRLHSAIFAVPCCLGCRVPCCCTVLTRWSACTVSPMCAFMQSSD